MRFYESYYKLMYALPTGSVEEYQAAARVLVPYLNRICDVSENVFGMSFYRKQLPSGAGSIDAERAVTYLRMSASNQRIYGDQNLSPSEKIIQLKHSLAAADSLEFTGLSINLKGNISSLYREIGDLDSAAHYMRAALSDAYRIDHYPMISQALGQMAYYHTVHGDADSVKICFDTAREIANRYRLAVQAPRISSFYARYYADHGRLSLAHDLYNESLELCRKYKSDYHEIRFLNDAMEFQADLDCWEIVGRLLKRARILERRL